MKELTAVYIEDILDSLDKIETYTKNLSLASFIADEKTQYAIRTCFMIIGEAAARLSTEYKDKHAEIPWKKIIGMRNILIHEYADIRLDTMWETIKTTLPPFKKQIEQLLKEAS